MDVMDLRAVITVVSFLVFIGIFIWAYSGRQKKRFDEASQLPFADDEMQERTIRQSHVDTSETNRRKKEADAEITHG